MVGCEEPYMGELSIIRPPASKKAAMTAVHSSFSLGSLPTLNVIQLPRPTTGSGSPVDGIGLVAGAPPCASTSHGSSTAAAVARAPGRMLRRDVPLACSTVCPSRIDESPRLYQ